MNTNTSRALLVLSTAMVLALSVSSCDRDTLIGIDIPPPGSGGVHGGGASGGTAGSTPGSGGSAGSSVGSGGAPASGWGFRVCPTVTTVPGQANSCGRTNDVAFSPDGSLVATATDTGTPFVHVWRLSDGQLLYEPDGGEFRDGAYTVAFSPDGKLLASAGMAPRTVVDGVSSQADTDTVDIWDAATGALIVALPTDCGFYASAAVFSHDGKHLVTAGYRNAIEIWNVADWSRALTIPYDTYSIYSARYSPDDTRIITTSAGISTIWNASDGTKVAELSGLVFDMNAADYAPDGSLILSTAGEGQIELTDPNGVNLQTIVFRTGPSPLPLIDDVAWIGGDRLLADDASGLIEEWTRNPAAATPPFVFSRSWMVAGAGWRMAVAPDRSRFVVGGQGGFTFLLP